ncbi:hypothetical protein DRI50_05560 [candidate division KSB1 bacterium]|nr:MAG: hypothetical protein DRI50_05560 [candidate division KSB1 bacterium]
MKRFIAAFVLILLFLAIGFSQSAAPDSVDSEIQLRTYLAKDAVPLNKEVVYYVELSWQGELNRYHILDISDPVLTNLKLRGSGSANRFYLDKNKHPHSVKKITFYFTPLEMGMAYIDGITIKYEDTATNQTGRLISERLPVKILEPVDQPGKGLDLGKILIIGLVLLFLFVVLFSIARYFQKTKDAAQPQEENLTPEETALKELRENIQLSRDLPEKKFEKLQQLFNSYLKERFGLPSGSEFHEIKIILEANGIGDGLIQKLKDFFERGELVKFAGEPVSESELHIFLDTVELILNEMNKRNISGQQA